MLEQDKKAVSEGMKQKLEEVRRRAFEEELARLNHLVDQQVIEISSSLKGKSEQQYRQQMSDAEESRRREEEKLIIYEEDARMKLAQERQRRDEHRRQETTLAKEADQQRKQREAEARTKAEEERLRQEDLMRQQREEFRRREEERIKQETERKLQEVERKKKADEERRKTEEELRVKEEERKRKEEQERIRREQEEEKKRTEESLRLQLEEKQRAEEEARKQQAEAYRREKEEEAKRKEAERLARIEELIAKAEAFLAEGDIEHARVEISKALVNDPENKVALELQAKVKGPEKEKTETAPQAKRPKKRKFKDQKRITKEDQAAAKNRFVTPISLAIAAGAIIIIVIVFMQLRGRLFSKDASLAVLPFTAASGTPDDAAEGTSLSEEVSQNIQESSTMRVLNFASTFELSKFSPDPNESIFRLGYPYLLKGTYTASDSVFTVSVQMIDSTGTMIWSSQYDKPMSAISSVASLIASDVLKMLNPRSMRNSSDISARQSTTSATVYVDYLKGRELLHRHTLEDTRNALQWFRQAIGLDQNFAPALASASASIVELKIYDTHSSPSMLQEAHGYADKAIQSNGAMSDGYVALGSVLSEEKNYNGALDQFDAAEKLSPYRSDLFAHRADVYLRAGKLRDALEALNKAYERNPRDPNLLKALGLTYHLNHQPQQGFGFYQAAFSLFGDSVEYAVGPLADAVLNDPDLSLSHSAKIVAAFERRLRADSSDIAAMYRFGRMLQVSGKSIEGTALMQKLDKMLRTEIAQHPANALAHAYLALTQTRLGKFAEAIAAGKTALGLDSTNVEVKYKIAQMYSLQMYSRQKKKTDEKKREEAVKILREALAGGFRPDEIANADFYNLYDEMDFRTIITPTAQ